MLVEFVDGSRPAPFKKANTSKFQLFLGEKRWYVSFDTVTRLLSMNKVNLIIIKILLRHKDVLQAILRRIIL